MWIVGRLSSPCSIARSVTMLAAGHCSSTRMCVDDPVLAREVLSLLRAHDTAQGMPGLADRLLCRKLGHEPRPRELASSRILRRQCWPAEGFRHYRIEEEIGAGGMGVVYRAYDLALGRDAAFKTLPDEFSAPLRQKLLKEAEASSRLQHPGIETTFL